MTKKRIAVFIVFAFLMQIAISAVFYFDDGREEVEQFLNSNHSVVEMIGKPIKLTLTQLSNVDKSIDSSAYDLYRFNAQGSRKSTTVFVRVNFISDNKKEFLITSIK